MPGAKPIILGKTAREFDMLATAVVGSIVGYAGKYKDLVAHTLAKGLGKEMFSLQATPHIVLKPHINLNNLVPEIALATVVPDRIAQLKQCLTDDSQILVYKFRPLTGIWASSMTCCCRQATVLRVFYVGTREFDPVKFQDRAIG